MEYDSWDNPKDFDISMNIYSHFGYGGWKLENYHNNDLSISCVNNDNSGDGDDGGGGDPGGGCPYLSPWNGTKYKQENNLLVQSEFQNGEVTDYYKLDTDLQQKNGNYSMKIDEFENSEDFIDQMKLYTLDHKPGYEVGVTPEGEYMTYKNSSPPEGAHNSTGDDVLSMIEQKNDGKRLQMNKGSEIIIDYGNRTMSHWTHNKLIIRSSGFESFTDENDFQLMWNPGDAYKTSLYVSLKAGDSDWHNVTCIHPRNHPHDHVIPLEDAIWEVLWENPNLDDLKVKIRSTKAHKIDYVGIDKSVSTPVIVQEASLLETIKYDVNGDTIYQNRSLTEDDNAVMHLIPGESCTVNFAVPYQVPSHIFEERDFIVMTKGFYRKYS